MKKILMRLWLRKKDEELQKSIIESYPSLYNFCNFFFCGRGWYSLIDRLSFLINKEKKHLNSLISIVLVKERLGKLFIKLSDPQPALDQIIQNAIKESAYICESCGYAGTLYLHPHMKTRCEICFNKEKNIEIFKLPNACHDFYIEDF